MTDFDFEELDKAVSGAIGDTPVSNDTTDGVSVPDTTTPDTNSAPAARRSSGRFMDMVHPASDMRTSRPTQSPAPRVESRPEQTLVEDRPIEDPLKPAESPFLPDAKVEKRPLGSEEATGALSQVNPIDLLEEPEEPLLEAPDDPRIEAHAMPDPIDFAAKNEGESHPVVEEAKVAEVDTTHDEPAPVADTAPAGPDSITQQYKEQPSSTAQSGAIYDTEAYHQPVPKPAKKRSGAWIILWILILVILGAAAGAAFYIFVLPML